CWRSVRRASPDLRREPLTTMTLAATPRMVAGGCAAVALIGLPWALSEYWVNVLSQGLIFAVFAMSLDLLLGYTGLPSLGHAAFFGIGAYGVGLAVLKAGHPLWLATVIALAAAVLLAAVFGALALRTRGAYFLMITLALA